MASVSSLAAYRYVAVLPSGGRLQSETPRPAATSFWVAAVVVVTKALEVIDVRITRDVRVRVRVLTTPSLT